MKTIKDFIADKRGATDLVFRLVLAITIGAAVLVVLLHFIHEAQDSGMNATKTAGEGLKIFAENVSQEISG